MIKPLFGLSGDRLRPAKRISAVILAATLALSGAGCSAQHAPKETVSKTVAFDGTIGDMRAFGTQLAIRNVIASYFEVEQNVVKKNYKGVEDMGNKLNNRLASERQRVGLLPKQTQDIDVIKFAVTIDDVDNPQQGGSVTIADCAPATPIPDCSSSVIPHNNGKNLPKEYSGLKSYQIFATPEGGTRDIITIR